MEKTKRKVRRKKVKMVSFFFPEKGCTINAENITEAEKKYHLMK